MPKEQLSMVGGKMVMEYLISCKVVRKGLSPILALTQRSKGREGGSHADIWGNTQVEPVPRISILRTVLRATGPSIIFAHSIYSLI